jgi:hypothetical protein
MRSVDARARRAAVLFEIAAVADRYEQDTGPGSYGERLGDLLATADGVLLAYESVGVEGFNPAVLELAGRCLAWLEADAEAEQRQ